MMPGLWQFLLIVGGLLAVMGGGVLVASLTWPKEVDHDDQ